MIQFDSFSLGYGSFDPDSRTVDKLTLSVNPGEIISILGPNGCGKSSLMYFLSGYMTEPPISASHKKSQVLEKSILGYVPQDFNVTIMDWLTGIENIALPLVLNGRSRKQSLANAKQLVDSIYKKLPMNLPVHQLSGGQKQIVVLCREMLLTPKYFLIDEGFSALDFETKYNVMSRVRDWCIRHKICVFSISHNPQEAAFFSDKIFIMTGKPMSIRFTDYNFGPVSRKINDLKSPWFFEITEKLQEEFLAVI